MAAGLICVFMAEAERFPFGSEFNRYYGEEKIPFEIPDCVSCDILPFHNPKLSTFEYIRKIIPDGTHVSSNPTQLVAELASTNPEIWQEVKTFTQRNAINERWVNWKTPLRATTFRHSSSVTPQAQSQVQDKFGITATYR
jgi:hypothetical protein